MKRWVAIALASVVSLTSFVPTQAMPITPPIKTQSDVTVVDHYYGHYRRPPPRYYHGHRGYRDYRPGYRRHNDGWWYPLAAFGAGVVIGGAIAAPPAAPRRATGINPRHYEWCYARYRSYDSYSNTFQPNYGPRRQCLSPYY
ncbi:BA14K family protein [Rhizobium cremeum]|nr:BA14K family protein [Rhizobium cremeum]MCJ7996226.1 BA14K family protein [Rhizobium cremeum]MCJ8001485.1 BA14K family protein [Rhizobium cremeum]